MSISIGEFARVAIYGNSKWSVRLKYLLEGKYNISEIAFKVGINNLFYFRQCFKEEFGCIPSEYLKKLKENTL